MLRFRSKVRMVEKPMSTTSYAILGLLSLRSWTGYELAQQGKRSLAHVWPKEESVIYEEPHRLVARGLATAHREQHKGRARNRYEITDAGRAALRDWLASPALDPKFEFEPMVRLLGVHEGEVADALAAVSTMRAWAQSNLAGLVPIGRDFLETGGPFPQRQGLNVIAGLLLGSLYDAIIDWAAVAETELATWERTDGSALTDGARALLVEWLAAHPPRTEGGGTITGNGPIQRV